jgi:hypothetical protein
MSCENAILLNLSNNRTKMLRNVDNNNNNNCYYAYVVFKIRTFLLQSSDFSGLSANF